MDSEKVVRAMAKWWQTVSQEEDDQNARNPMLYDPLQDGVIKTSKTMQYVAALVVCLGAVAAGTALAWTSPVLPQITADAIAPTTMPAPTTHANDINSVHFNTTQTPASAASLVQPPVDELKLTLDQRKFQPMASFGLTFTCISLSETWVSSLLAIGAILGALPTGYIADAIGRRYTALIMDVPFIVAWLAIIFAKSAGALYFGRFLIGISTGSFCVVAPMYVSEIAEVSIRGTVGTLFQLLLTIGILLVYLIGAAVTWRTLSALCLVVPIALFIGMLFLPETPTYLLKKGRRGDAALALKWLWGRYCDSRSAIQAIQSDLDSAGGGASFVDLFRHRAALNGLIISVLLMLFQQFSGINAVIFYTVPIFQSAGSTLDPSICSIIVGLVQVVMTLVSSLLIERAGRKILLLFSSSVMTLCLLMLGAYFDMKDGGQDVSSIGWLPLLCVVLFMITFSVGYGPVPWLMMGELFVPDLKAIAVALTVIANWLSAFVVTKCFGSMISSWGSDWTFWFFAIWMFVATLYVAFMVLETRGKSTIQIQTWLGGNK